MRARLEEGRLLKPAELREAAFAARFVALSASALRTRPALARVHEALCATEGRRVGIGLHLRRLGGAARHADAAGIERLLGCLPTVPPVPPVPPVAPRLRPAPPRPGAAPPPGTASPAPR